MKRFRIMLFLITCSAVHVALASHLPHNFVRTAPGDTDTVIRKRSISAGVSYGSDASFFGRTGPITYPYMSTDVVYNTKGGFFLYGSALKLLGYPTLEDEVDVGGGYLYRFSKKWKGSVSYNRFIFSNNERVISSATNNDVNWKNSYNWNVVQPSVTFDYLFGKTSDFFTTLSISKYIEPSWNVFNDNDYLTFNPSIIAILGTQNFVQTYSTDHENQISADDIAILGNGRVPYNNGRFNMLNYSFKIPVAYNHAHYTFEASYKYSIPVNVEGALKNKRESFYNLTFYYLFY